MCACVDTTDQKNTAFIVLFVSGGPAINPLRQPGNKLS